MRKVRACAIASRCSTQPSLRGSRCYSRRLRSRQTDRPARGTYPRRRCRAGHRGDLLLWRTNDDSLRLRLIGKASHETRSTKFEIRISNHESRIRRFLLFGTSGCVTTQTAKNTAAPPVTKAEPVKQAVAEQSAKQPQQPIQQVSTQEAIPGPTTANLPQPRTLPPAMTTPDASMTGSPNMQRMATNPSAVGAMLNLQPHDNPVERTVELAQRLGTVEAEKAALASRVQHLEVAIETRDRMLADSIAKPIKQ